MTLRHHFARHSIADLQHSLADGAIIDLKVQENLV
jgi:hypothetical protein